MNYRRWTFIITVFVLAAQACFRLDARASHPRAFVGRWARLGTDTVWGDTIELFADGRARGWTSPPTSDSIRWDVVQSRFGEAFCAGTRARPNCQPFRLEGDTLVLGNMPKQSYLRRARDAGFAGRPPSASGTRSARPFIR